ncbi:MAG: AhpC/TSA family protein, partial [Thiotrichaceae bacterium]|nr:AhpC/TSA family protein [Thiotrichaceae bacterium]
NDDIQQQREQTLAKAPQDAIDVLVGTTQDLKDQGIENNALGVGDQAIDFNLPNIHGQDVNLKQALAKGPVVLNIYRGGWCPYCNMELNALQQALPDIEATGAQLIAVAPQLPDKSIESAEKHKLAFEVLSDVGNKVSREYVKVQENWAERTENYEMFGLDIPH